MTSPRTQPDAPGKPMPARPREISSESLFQGGSQLVIVHNDQRYQLRITSNRKLILTL